jgi:hypothetical protein
MYTAPMTLRVLLHPMTDRVKHMIKFIYPGYIVHMIDIAESRSQMGVNIGRNSRPGFEKILLTPMGVIVKYI